MAVTVMTPAGRELVVVVGGRIVPPVPVLVGCGYWTGVDDGEFASIHELSLDSAMVWRLDAPAWFPAASQAAKITWTPEAMLTWYVVDDDDVFHCRTLPLGITPVMVTGYTMSKFLLGVKENLTFPHCCRCQSLPR